MPRPQLRLRPQPLFRTRGTGQGMTTAEYAVCVTCVLGIVSVLASEPFRDFLFDLLASIWQLALQPRHLLHLVEITGLTADVPHPGAVVRLGDGSLLGEPHQVVRLHHVDRPTP